MSNDPDKPLLYAKSYLDELQDMDRKELVREKIRLSIEASKAEAKIKLIELILRMS